MPLFVMVIRRIKMWFALLNEEEENININTTSNKHFIIYFYDLTNYKYFIFCMWLFILSSLLIKLNLNSKRIICK